ENQVKNLGVVTDADLNFNSHNKTITKSSYYHLKNIARLRGFMSQQDLEKLVHSFIFSRLDYCNGVFTVQSKKKKKKKKKKSSQTASERCSSSSD
ncbi:hypothetical protein LDENG_00272520, partial [Lucifuga dentata]